jgi:peptidyl-prolyl cis-trans isomerase D
MTAIQDYFEKNKDRFVNPEQVQLQFIELKLAQIAEGIKISEEELRTSYQEQIAKYGRPEERAASHVLVKLPPNAGEAEVEQARTKARQMADSIHSGAKSFDQVLQDAQADQSGQLEGGDWVSSPKACLTAPR